MYSIDILILEKILRSKIPIKNIKLYIENISRFLQVHRMDILTFYLMTDKVVFDKNNFVEVHEEINDFVKVNQDMINQLVSHDLFYTITNYNDSILYFLNSCNNIDNSKILLLLNKFQELGIISLYFEPDGLDNIYITKINEDQDFYIEHYISDGEKRYMNQVCQNQYPFLLRNANYVIKYIKTNFKTFICIIINDFNFDLDDLPNTIYEIEEESIDFNEIKRITDYIDTYYFIKTIISNIDSLKNIDRDMDNIYKQIKKNLELTEDDLVKKKKEYHMDQQLLEICLLNKL